MPASSNTRSASSLLDGSMIRASTNCRNTSSPSAAASNPSTSYADDRASHRCPIREAVIGNGPPASGEASRLSSSSPCPAVIRCRATVLSSSNSTSSWAEPMCSISREPWREECTICTARAPDAVFTVRM